MKLMRTDADTTISVIKCCIDMHDIIHVLDYLSMRMKSALGVNGLPHFPRGRILSTSCH